MKLADFKVKDPIQLNQFPTELVIPGAKEKLRKIRRKISQHQNAMYAEAKYNVLICLQGMDTSGKDSLIREVFKDVNTSGVVVHSFKTPTTNELKHDFLWRHYVALPVKGKIGVFNRSHYENVLFTRVHPHFLLKENIPRIQTVEDATDEFFYERMRRINQFERHIAKNGTIVLKFFLNISKDEQKYRLLRRLKYQEKNWKFSDSDLKERKLWDQYMRCYEDVLNRTSKKKAPWYVIPADDKPTARLIFAKVLLKELAKYTFETPSLEKNLSIHVDDFIKELENE